MTTTAFTPSSDVCSERNLAFTQTTRDIFSPFQINYYKMFPSCFPCPFADLNTEYLDLGFSRGLGSSSRAKRMRTSFKHHQLRTMKSYFAINHNPDAKDLKQLSQKTGLPKRVLQVRISRNATVSHQKNHKLQLFKLLYACKTNGRIYFLNQSPATGNKENLLFQRNSSSCANEHHP